MKNGLSPQLINNVFEFIEKPLPLRANSHFRSKRTRTSKYITETTPYLGPKLWNLVPNEYKTITSLEDFKPKIKTWVPKNWPCRLYKTYIHQIDFI